MSFLHDISISFANDNSSLQRYDIGFQHASLGATLDNIVALGDKKSMPDILQGFVNTANSKIIVFQIDRALNIDFNDVKIEHGVELLHSDDEYQALYDGFLQQNGMNVRQNTIGKQDDGHIADKEMNLKLSSLYYYNDNNWGCTVNNRFIKKSNQDEVHSNVSIVKVNKDNILFVLNETKEDDIVKIRQLKNSNYRYRSAYYIVKNGKIKSLMFRLYTGQSINLKSFKIR